MIAVAGVDVDGPKWTLVPIAFQDGRFDLEKPQTTTKVGKLHSLGIHDKTINALQYLQMNPSLFAGKSPIEKDAYLMELLIKHIIDYGGATNVGSTPIVAVVTADHTNWYNKIASCPQ